MGDSCSLSTCDLFGFNNAYPWFEKCHLTHLRKPSLDSYNSPLPLTVKNIKDIAKTNQSRSKSDICKNCDSFYILF